jgi:hypothetical protein
MPDPAQAPDVPLPVWRRLHEAAADLRALEPWKWMRDDDLFGVRDPATGAVHTCCILSDKGGPPGLALYRGQAGLRFLFRKDNDPGNPVHDNEPLLEDSLTVEYVGRKLLDPTDRAVWDALQLPRPALARAPYPLFRSMLPAHPPWYLNTDEARLLTTALVLAQAFSQLVDEKPDLFGDRPYEEVPVYTRVGGAADSPWKLDWIKMDLDAPAQPVKPPVLPAADVAEARRRPPKPLEWEVATYFPPLEVNEAPRPYHPRAAVIARSDGTELVHFALNHPARPAAALAADTLVQAIARHGLRPEAVSVDAAELAEGLWPLLEQLGIRLRFRHSLPGVRNVQEFLRDKLGTGDDPSAA